MNATQRQRDDRVAQSKSTAGPWLCASIFAATLITYWPALNGGFLWDDMGHVTRPDLRSLAGLGHIWFEVGATQQYYPMLHSAFWLEHRLWGDATLGYHLVNVLLHATAACLFGTALRRLAVPGAGLAALLFALHPVCVESVAWISEQKNTLSAVLYLSALLAYLKFDTRRNRAHYALAISLFVLALLTKTVTATLPAALLLIFWWQRGQLAWRRDAQPLLPWFVLAATAGLVTAWFEQTLIGAQGVTLGLTAVGRCLLAGRALWFYLGKLVWPADLIFIYPRWTINATIAWQWLFPIAAVGVLAWLWRRRAQRGPLAAALFFAGTLFPGLGFVNVFPFRYSYVADHFQYLACLGFLAATAAWFTNVIARWPALMARTAILFVLIVLGALTWRQSSTFRDVFALYRTTLARNPECWMARNNLGIALADAGQPAEAIPHYEAALRLQPDFPEAENNLGYALATLGKFAEAVPHYRRALQRQPTFAEAHNNLGVALMSLGQAEAGLTAFAAALRDNPHYAGAHYNIGLALARLGRTTEAITHFARTVQIQPDHSAAEFNWGIGLMLTDRFAAARPHFERALELDPDSAASHVTYARALTDHGYIDAAIAQYRAALRLNPDASEAHFGLALALRQAGRLEEAEHHFREARRLAPPAR